MSSRPALLHSRFGIRKVGFFDFKRAAYFDLRARGFATRKQYFSCHKGFFISAGQRISLSNGKHGKAHCRQLAAIWEEPGKAMKNSDPFDLAAEHN